MPVIVAPYTPPPPALAEAPPPILRQGFRHTLLGWDGSEWDLTGMTSGVVLVEGGVRGLGMPPVTHYRDQSPALPGSRYRGTRVEDRSGFWPVFVYHDDTEQDWINLNQSFTKTMRPTEISTWRVIQPNAATRYLDVRYEGGLDEPFEADPSFRGWALHGITLNAEQPYWRGDAILRTFETRPTASGLNFGGPGVINIFPGVTFDTASISNPGDVPSRVAWVLRGPLESARVGVGSKMIDVPFQLFAGEVLTIYTEPDLMLALDGDGVDRTDDLGPTSDLSGTIQPGSDARLSVRPGSAVGGSIEASLVPLYYMAF